MTKKKPPGRLSRVTRVALLLCTIGAAYLFVDSYRALGHTPSDEALDRVRKSELRVTWLSLVWWPKLPTKDAVTDPIVSSHLPAGT